MSEVLVRSFVIAAATVLWFAGLRLFIQSGLSSRRRIVWTACLAGVGIAIGLLLSASQVWQKFLILLALLPALAAVDILLMRSGRGLTFWIRACGFEVVTVFALAAVTRLLCDRAGFAAFLERH